MEPYDSHIIQPGPWRLTSWDGLSSCQVLVLRRRYSLALVRVDPLPEVAGTKRPRQEASETRDPVQDPAHASSSPGKAEIIKHLDSITDMSDGEMVHVVTANVQDYSLFRMRKAGDTRAARVFQARHSDYPNQTVIIKAFRFDSRHSAIRRGENWKNEYSIHRKLRSVCSLPSHPETHLTYCRR